MVTEALFVRMETASGRNDDLARFFATSPSAVEETPAEVVWLGFRLGTSIYDGLAAVPNEAGSSEASLQAYLSNHAAAVLMALAAELLVQAPELQKGGAGEPQRRETTFDL